MTAMDRFFHADLKEIKADIQTMSDNTLIMVRDSVLALRTQDKTLALHVCGRDDSVDELEKKIDREAMRYLTLFGPVGTDVRLLMTVRDIGHDLERAADEASGIAKRVIRLGKQLEELPELLELPRMANIAAEMLEAAVNSFFTIDTTLAQQVIARDDEIDRLNLENYHALFGKDGHAKSSMVIAVELMFISKSLERIADHATNIAEQTVFLRSGEDIRHSHLS